MFPNAKNPPALTAQGSLDLHVAQHVPANFGNPIIPPAFRHPAVFWAPVPEAAVDEDGELVLSKNEVRPSGKLLVTTPAGDFIGLEDGDKGQLGALVAARPNAGHQPGPLLLGESIRHSISLPTGAANVRRFG